jgi:hypothetical protein
MKRRRQGARSPPTEEGTVDEEEAAATAVIAARPAANAKLSLSRVVRSSPTKTEDAPRRRRPVVGSKEDVG